MSLLYNVSHRRYGWHSLARRGLSKSLSKCLGSAQIFGAPNGRHFTVRDLLDAMVKHEKRLMRFPTGHAHFVGLRQHERWPAMYYVVWEWYPDEGEPFLMK